jgi:hypothetical protein
MTNYQLFLTKSDDAGERVLLENPEKIKSASINLLFIEADFIFYLTDTAAAVTGVAVGSAASRDVTAAGFLRRRAAGMTG